MVWNDTFSEQFHFSGTDTCPHDNGIVRAINAHYKPNERIVGNPRHTIFIGKLHLKTDEVINPATFHTFLLVS